MSKTFLPQAFEHGAKLLSSTRAKKLSNLNGKWYIQAETQEGNRIKPITIETEAVFVCGGAIQTPALLRRSGITNNIGNSLRFHPALKVVGLFDDIVNQLDMGVPVYQISEFSPEFRFGCSVSSPPYLAIAMMEHSSHLNLIPTLWQNMGLYYAMTSQGLGQIRVLPGFKDPIVRYKLSQESADNLLRAFKNLCLCLLEAGATTIYPSIHASSIIRSKDDLKTLPDNLDSIHNNLMTVHMFSSCPMGENKRLCATNSFGKVFGHQGLYINDASLLCGPTGVNPQGTIMAITRRNALHFTKQL